MAETIAKPKYTGYGYHGGGRKATEVKRVSFSVSCQPEELAELKRRAKSSGLSVSNFILNAPLK